jgi:hypothetical protein
MLSNSPDDKMVSKLDICSQDACIQCWKLEAELMEEEQITSIRGEVETILTCGRTGWSNFLPGPAAGTSAYKGAEGLFSAKLSKDLTSK